MRLQIFIRYILLLTIIFLSFSISVYLYPLLPESIAIHWDAEGKPNNYTSKIFGILIIPIIIVFLSLLFLIIPKIDPLKSNIEKFRKYYDYFVVSLLFFMFLIHLWMLLWNIGIKISPNSFFPIVFSFLFFYISILLKHARRNWFIGIRTPWTLSNEKVWDKTHKIGGKLFKIAAVISFFGIFFNKYSWLFIILPVILFSLYLIIYSYFEYCREKTKKNK